MVAQTAAPIAGQYYLEGVRETASGFKLNEDSSFEFFFSSPIRRRESAAGEIGKIA